MAITKILVPVDGSTYSLKAFRIALDIAKNNNAKINVLTCLEKEDVGAWYIDKRTNKKIMNDAKKFAKDFLSKLEKPAKDANIPISLNILETKSVSNQIITFSNSNKIDLIVIGSHGRGGFNKFLLGSVSNKVSQMAKCPVMIVK
ncbi:universal stress protein [Nitrosopumilus ureiphilus]|uniref:Universal stress protein n=1 Tax=Nitrosopumilus ureiphilus TaxID=1470067 RepID=A0A7D5RBZ1_9ARCH|nr:universal stress protein [Nitrosopumilus ureiphilus]QLH07402.1 universal stress protein [Nitrosopumilus ureiphilus]